jgi:hypothetical protein
MALGLAGGPAFAQTVGPTTSDDVTLGFQLEKPFFPNDGDLGSWSSSLETDLLFRWSGSSFVQAFLPVAFAGAENVDGTSLYLGGIGASFVFGPPGAPGAFLGFTLPTAGNIAGPDLAVLVGVLPNQDEPELWAEDVMSVRAGLLPSWQLSESTRVGLRVGGALLAPTELDDLFAHGRGGVWGSATAGAAELRADLVSSLFINSGDEFAERFSAYLDARATLPNTPGRPGVVVHLPLDTESRDVLDLSIGFAARIGL